MNAKGKEQEQSASKLVQDYLVGSPETKRLEVLILRSQGRDDDIYHLKDIAL